MRTVLCNLSFILDHLGVCENKDIIFFLRRMLKWEMKFTESIELQKKVLILHKSIKGKENVQNLQWKFNRKKCVTFNREKRINLTLNPKV